MSATLQRPHRWCLSLGVLWILASAPASSASTIEFKWPVPTRVSVWMGGEADSTHFFAQWVTRVDPTPFPEELRVQSEHFEIPLMDVHREEGVQPRTNLESGIEAIIAAPPPMMISRSGEYLRFAGMDDFVNATLGSLRTSLPHAKLPKSAWSRIEAVLRSPEVSAHIESQASDTWNLWTEGWTGFELEPGEERPIESSMSFEGVSIPAKVSIRNLGPADLDSELVWMQLEVVLEGEAWVKALQQGEPGEKLRSARRVERMVAVLERTTARPAYASYAQAVQIVSVAGASWNDHTESEYYFDWTPPLGRPDRRDPLPDSLIAWFQQGRLEDASRLVVKAAAEGSRLSDLHAYKSEICRRLQKPGEALYAGRRAVALDPRSSFAHDALAEAYLASIQWNQTYEDSAWAYLRKGIACDSTDGNLWMRMHSGALARKERDMASRSLRALMGANFFTPAALAYARWMVQDLPENTLLLTNGDLDTYPAWCLQEVEGLRPGIAVVNVSLLNSAWYARHVRDRYGVPLPWKDTELDTVYRWEEGKAAPVSRVLDAWASWRKSGKLSRPLHVSTTVDSSIIPLGMARQLQLVGSSWKLASDTSEGVDTTAVRRSLERIRPEEFRGPVTSERDRSPVRRQSAMVHNIVNLGITYAEALMAADRQGDAELVLRQAESMAKRAGFEGTAVAERIRAAWASMEQPSK